MILMARKKICSDCGKIFDDAKGHDCPKADVKRKEATERKRLHDAKNESSKMLRTTRWRKFRKYIINRDNNRCQRCTANYGVITVENLEVHHIKPRITHPELMYDEENVITVCQTCNLQLGTSGIDFDWTPPEEDYKL